MRIALTVSYQGTHYYGWQAQKDVPTVQAHLEQALSRVGDHPITVTCAGRTDKGVHALGQVIHFTTEAKRIERAWCLGSNTYLPNDIRVQSVATVSDDFHARYSATARLYRYVIYNDCVPSAIWHHQTAWCYQQLEHKRMQQAAHYLLGEHDFSAYRAAECQANSPIRTIYQLDVERQGKFVLISAKANGFLHHMVRNIAGVLMDIGMGKHEPSWAKDVLQARDRRVASVTASPSGLYFMKAYYPHKILSAGFINDMLNFTI
jgi:tRNA pseudouridine38-40 synthase